MLHQRTFIRILQTLYLLLLTFLLPAEEIPTDYSPIKATYLPEYRIHQLFPTDITGSVPWYDMNPLPEFHNSYYNEKKILPAEYRQSRGEILLGNFSEVLYFAIGFAEEEALDIDDQDRNNLNYLSRIKELYNTDISLCFAGSSREILPRVSDTEKRIETVEAIQDLLVEYNLSGMDLDWEFPRNDQEKGLHLSFLRELKLMTRASGKNLSMAVSRYRLLPEEAYDIPDRINLMTYDFYGRHSTWEGTLEAVEYMMARYRIPPEKLSMGLPFYGRIYDGYSPDYWKKSQSYQEIVRDYSPGPDDDEAGGYFFNGPTTVLKKLSIASEHTLGGIFIWEIGQDILNKASLSRLILDYQG